MANKYLPLPFQVEEVCTVLYARQSLVGFIQETQKNKDAMDEKIVKYKIKKKKTKL